MQKNALWFAVLPSILLCSLQTASANEEIMVAGDCFVYRAPKAGGSAPIDRIEVQYVQMMSKDNIPQGGQRVQIGIQPHQSDDVIPTGITDPCAPNGSSQSCTLTCREVGTEKSHGRLRITPIANSKLKLTIEEQTTLNACSPTETAVVLPAALVGRTFTLTRRGRSDCFH